MPQVVGLCSEVATQRLEAQGLAASTEWLSEPDPRPIGEVTSSRPAEGAEVEPGNTVVLVLSSGSDSEGVYCE